MLVPFHLIFQMTFVKIVYECFIKLLLLQYVNIVITRHLDNSKRMKTIKQRESLYAIQPWNQENTCIPLHFLTTDNFVQLSLKQNNRPISSKKIQVAADSIYLIKHQNELKDSPLKSNMRYHRTAQTSPRILPSSHKQDSTRRNSLQKISKSNKINSHFDKKKDRTQQIHRKFQETKQTFIEFKVIKKKKSNINREDDNPNSKILQNTKSNLLKKYQKSTQNVSKKQAFDKDIDEDNPSKRKIKTESGSKRQISFKHMLSLQDPQRSKLYLRKSQRQIRDSGHNISDPNDKLRFQLALQRKLFLMKSTSNQWFQERPMASRMIQ